MADNLSKEHRSKNMRAIRSVHTQLEDRVTQALWKRGFRIRKNVKDLKGKPDIAVKRYKVAVFIDSCFWHGCEIHGNQPKTNETYWGPKLARNRERDAEVTAYYRSKSWNVLRIWEHDIKDSIEEAADRIAAFLEKAKQNHQANRS
ncbi:very short patch repair endonuclease [Paenibacillus sp. GP183]|uniref:very short patch repair endonuclease n=1 Tax=Paenibacillus sp. GP183 TaxID=1882751 RepID=UPI00089ABA72|nr:very short patch repair endonuclease [Paenibacillus sp. GP183]SED14889.1 T/G mismatch-specific endonuclease [Paenibacillus sp. GP183]